MRIAIGLLAITAWGQVASMTEKDLSGSTQAARPITRGRVFAQGDIANFPKPRVNGVVPSLWQANVLNRWGDGSVKFAVISYHADIAANATIAVDFVNDSTNTCHLGNQATCDAAALDQTALLALRSSAWAATIEITNGTTQTASARSMLSAGYWRYWLKGPVMTQVIIEEQTGRTQDMGFGGVSGLHPQFILTAYPNYTAGVRLEYILENSWTDRLVDQTYSLNVKTSSATPYTRTSFTHYGRGRWHKGAEHSQIWDGTAPGSILTNHNVAYMIGAKALPNMDSTLTPNTAASLASWNASGQGIAFGDRGTLVFGMDASGSRNEIAFAHQYQIKALYSPTGMDGPLYGDGDIAAHVPVHIREARTDNYLCSYFCTGGNATTLAYGYPISSQSRPTFNRKKLSEGDTLDRVTYVGTVTNGGWTWDINHHPSLAYIPYIVTGSFFYYEEMAFWSGWISTDNSSPLRQYENSLAEWRNNQWRGSAWQLRTWGQMAFSAVDGSPYKQMYSTYLAKSAEFFEGVQNETGGNYPPADSSCPGFTVGTTGPTSGPSRTPWCFGRKYTELDRSNPLLLFPGQQSADCQQFQVATNAGYGRLDCSHVDNVGKPWRANFMVGYWTIAVGWINEAVMTGFSKALQNFSTTFIDSIALVPELGYKLLGGQYAFWMPVYSETGAYYTTWNQFRNIVKYSSTTLTTTIPSTTTTTFNVNDWTAMAWKPIWRRCGGTCAASTATSNAISSISVASGVVTVTFTTPHGLAVGDRILSSSHSNPAFNTNAAAGYVNAARLISAVPSSTSLSFGYIASDGQPKSGGNTGNGTLRMNAGVYTSLDVGTKVGVWQVRCITAATNGGVFTVKDPDGILVATKTISSGNTTITIDTSNTFTLSDGSVDYVVGDGFDITVATPADGSYTVESGYLVQTPLGAYSIKVDSEAMEICVLETDGRIVVGLGTNTDSMATFPSASSATGRGLYGTARATHSIGGTAGSAWNIWTDGQNSTGGYSWIMRAAASFSYGYTTASSTGAALWSWLDTNFYALWSGSLNNEPVWSLKPRSLASFSITTAGLASGVVNTSYSQTLTTSGATGSVTWTLVSGTLPTGITLNASTGVLSGTPTAVYSASLTFRATDSTTAFRDATFGLSITAPSGPTISTLSLPDGIVGSSYSVTLAATGGTTPYSWSVIGTPLPAGLGLASNGVLSGNPSVGNAPASAFSVTIRVTDAFGLTYDKVYSLTIAWLPLTITTASLPSGTIGTPYSLVLGYSGGNGSNLWSTTAGTFPAGLSIYVSSGTIAGTPNTPATYSFTVQVQSGDGQTATKNFTLDVPQPTDYLKIIRNIKGQGVIIK